MKRIAILASGSGTNAENIALYAKESSVYTVSLIMANKPTAYVLERAKKLGIDSVVFDKKDFTESDHVLNILSENKIDYIILAGFLWKIPDNLISAYPEKILNIHPALLPKYGGKGMYGDKVHQAVIENDEKKSGITIHLVNEIYDDGRIIFQDSCQIDPSDTPDSLAQKVHKLEYDHYPQVIQDYISEKESLN